MNDAHGPLKNWRTSQPSSEAQDRALEKSLQALRFRESEKISTRSPFASLAVAFGIVAASSLILSVVMWKSLPNANSEFVPLNAGTLAQFDALFGSSLNALIERDGQLEVETARPRPNRGQAILITAKTSSGPVHVISFSGSKFELNFGQEHLFIEPLIAADGSVLLCSDQFLWSSSQKSGSLPPELKTLQAVLLPTS
ncbi:MAG TPA: hypothetical protein VIT91_19125 [Chthoniobacterales bacterium]